MKKDLPVFFTPGEWKELITLQDSEAHHCTKVLRMRPSDKAILLNGKGIIYESVLQQTFPQVIFQVENQKKVPARQASLHLAVSPVKNIERFERFLEKSVEAGIETITPFISERSERKQLRTERMEKIILSAVKQSIQPYYPQFNTIKTFKEIINSSNTEDKFICSYKPENNFLADQITQGRSTLILIGPEGDFSNEEISFAIKNNFEAVNLSNSRLRTETAALMACFTFNIVNRF